ncbi:MAG: nitroreductase family protein [Promethearchaeota archaeon]
METLSIIKKRRHIHFFKPDPVRNEDIETLLEAARWAPSAGNLQPLEIVIVKTNSQKKQLVEDAGGKRYIASAPVIFVICADLIRSSGRYKDRGTALYVIQDTAAATQNILLTATALGLGSGWVGAFDEEKVAKTLELPAKIRPLAIILIGKAAEDPNPPPRRKISEFAHYETFKSTKQDQ